MSHGRHFLIAAATASLLLGACASKEADTSSDERPSLALSLSSATDQLKSLDTLMPDNATLALTSARSAQLFSNTTPLWAGADWMSHPMCSGGASDPHCQSGSNMVNLKEWMGYQIDPEAVRDNGSSINIFGRVQTAVQSICALSTALPTDSDGQLSVGETEVVFDEALVTTLSEDCGMDASTMVGRTAAITVARTTDATYYDFKVSAVNDDSSISTFYLRYNSEEVNVAMGESRDGGMSRTLLSYDIGAKLARAEYVSSNAGATSNQGGEFGRLYYDATNDDGAITYSTFDFQGTPNRLIYTLRGKPENGTEVAFSVRSSGFGITSIDAGYSFNTIFNACINQDNGDIITDNSVSCAGSVTGTATDDAGFVALFTDLYSSTDASGYLDYVDASVCNETVHVPFTTAGEIFSALPLH